MKMRQLLIKVELLEYKVDGYPEVTRPEVILNAQRMFLGEDVDPSMSAAICIAEKMGLEPTVYPERQSADAAGDE